MSHIPGGIRRIRPSHLPGSIRRIRPFSLGQAAHCPHIARMPHRVHRQCALQLYPAATRHLPPDAHHQVDSRHGHAPEHPAAHLSATRAPLDTLPRHLSLRTGLRHRHRRLLCGVPIVLRHLPRRGQAHQPFHPPLVELSSAYHPRFARAHDAALHGGGDQLHRFALRSHLGGMHHRAHHSRCVSGIHPYRAAGAGHPHPDRRPGRDDLHEFLRHIFLGQQLHLLPADGARPGLLQVVQSPHPHTPLHPRGHSGHRGGGSRGNLPLGARHTLHVAPRRDHLLGVSFALGFLQRRILQHRGGPLQPGSPEFQPKYLPHSFGAHHGRRHRISNSGQLQGGHRALFHTPMARRSPSLGTCPPAFAHLRYAPPSPSSSCRLSSSSASSTTTLSAA